MLVSNSPLLLEAVVVPAGSLVGFSAVVAAVGGIVVVGGTVVGGVGAAHHECTKRDQPSLV